MTNGEIILKLIKDITGIELELGEEFNVSNNLLKVTQEGLVYVDGEHLCYVPLHGFIDEIKEIKVKPKFPKNGTKYYYISPQSTIFQVDFNRRHVMDVLNYKIGNFFLTYEEAEQNKDRMIEFLKSPERIGL